MFYCSNGKHRIRIDGDAVELTPIVLKLNKILQRLSEHSPKNVAIKKIKITRSEFISLCDSVRNCRSLLIDTDYDFPHLIIHDMPPNGNDIIVTYDGLPISKDESFKGHLVCSRSNYDSSAIKINWKLYGEI